MDSYVDSNEIAIWIAILCDRINGSGSYPKTPNSRTDSLYVVAHATAASDRTAIARREAYCIGGGAIGG